MSIASHSTLGTVQQFLHIIHALKAVCRIFAQHLYHTDTLPALYYDRLGSLSLFCIENLYVEIEVLSSKGDCGFVSALRMSKITSTGCSAILKLELGLHT